MVFRIVFPHRKKTKKSDEIVEKKYILANETFEFGPLLVGKSRDKYVLNKQIGLSCFTSSFLDRYKEGKYPENMEKLVILNTSPLDAEITFCFLNDSKAETYLLDPPNMTLKPGEQQV
jgi:hydrocephalus-inducing protein